MTPINRFILHVVHNLLPLNEYSQGVLDKIIAHYREEADDLNISITDNQLKSYVERFDQIKPGIIQKGGTDLIKMGAGGTVEVIVPLSQLIRLISSRKAGGGGSTEEIDITPDVVYNNDDNTIVIYNGSKEANCVRYGNGEKWCITRTSFPTYRYSSTRSYPTFYLAKNNNLPTSNKLSFVAIQVRNPETTNENERYVYTDRTNSPNESDPMSFNQLMNEVPWLREVPNIKSILKYIPISSKEKLTQQYAKDSISYREWTKLPYSVKEQYLVVRKGKILFSDINNSTFVEKYLSKYPELARFIAETPDIIDSFTLLQNLDKFPNQIRRSITANVQTPIPSKYLSTESLPFDVKKLLVQLNKWDLAPNERLYVTKDGNTIVKLTLGDDMMVSLYQAEDDYPNIKLNKRTSKYLLDYPELDKIPLKNLLDLAGKEAIDRDLITRILDDAKNDPNSAIIVKNIDGKEIVLDSNTFASYEVLENGNVIRVPFDNEDVQQIFNDAKDNEAFQQNVVSLFKQGIPPTVDKEALTSIINAIPYNQRIITARSMPSVILSSNGRLPFFAMPSTVTPEAYSTNLDYGFYGNDWRRADFANSLGPEEWISYFNYLRTTNQSYSDDALLTVLNGMSGNSKKAFIANNPPIDNDGNLKPVMNGNTALLINRADPRNSRKVSDTGKLIKANIPSAVARQLLGDQPAAAPAANAPAADNDNVRRRGRPAGVPNAPRPQQPAAPRIAAQGNINVGAKMQENGLETGYLALPRSVRNAINVINATTAPITNNRGVSRRQNILGNAGRVTSVLDVGESTIYFIQLGNNTRIASLVKQPGNLHYIITNNNAYQLESPSQLLTALQQRNLAEIRHYIVREYFGRNPQHLDEFRQIFNEYITEKKK
jgi:hypothetical protein